jgi:hypothetical protein
VRRTTEPRRGSLGEADATDADATVRADAAVLALQSASASVDDALAEVGRQMADAQLRLDPERDQEARAAEAVKRETETEELKQTTDEFVKAGARLAESLSQVTVACTRFRRHRVRCFDGAGGGSWRDGSSRGSSSLRPCA